MLTYVLMIAVVIIILVILFALYVATSGEDDESDDPVDAMDAFMNSTLTQIASTDGKHDGITIMGSDMTAGQPMVMNLTFISNYMVTGDWVQEDHFEVHICGECSSEKVAKIRAMAAQAKNDCRITIKHDTANGPEIIYDC
jgi:hypothetical protein